MPACPARFRRRGNITDLLISTAENRGSRTGQDHEAGQVEEKGAHDMVLIQHRRGYGPIRQKDRKNEGRQAECETKKNQKKINT